jgi:DNA-binding CsgD family transcriptional regulator
MKKHAQNHRLQSLIDRVYDASIDDRAWVGLAEQIAGVFGSTSAVLKIQDSSSEHVHLVDMTENLVVGLNQQDWADHWQHNDLWVERSIIHGKSKIVTNRDLIPDAEFEKTAFYNDWIRHLDIYHMIGAVFPVDKDAVGVVGIHRPSQAGAYQAPDRRLLARFLPHLLRAFYLRQKLLRAQLGVSTAIDALEQTHSAIIVVDSCLSILYATPLAEQMLRQKTDLAVVYGKLEIRQPGESCRLAHLVQGCVHNAAGIANLGGGIIAVQRSRKLPLVLSVAPLSSLMPDGTPQGPAALIFIRDPEGLKPSVETLRHLYGLTGREASVAQALSQGQSLSEIAEAFSIGMGTVRSHLKKILSKTNTGKQAELVALLLRSAAGIQS